MKSPAAQAISRSAAPPARIARAPVEELSEPTPDAVSAGALVQSLRHGGRLPGKPTRFQMCNGKF